MTAVLPAPISRSRQCWTQAKLQQTPATVGEAIAKLVTTNARVAQNQTKYQQRFYNLSAEHAQLLQQHGIILAEITDLQNRLNAYGHYKLIIV